MENFLQEKQSHEKTISLLLSGQEDCSSGVIGVSGLSEMTQEKALFQQPLLVGKWCYMFREGRRQKTPAFGVPGNLGEGARCKDGPRGSTTLRFRGIWR